MTKDETIAMAKQVGAGMLHGGEFAIFGNEKLEAFAKLVAAKAIAELESQEPWCMKMNGCKTKCEDCPEKVPQSTDPDWDALAEKQLASIKGDMKISFEDAAVRATHKVMAELEYSFKAYWETDGRIGVVACIERPDGGVHLMSEILDLPPSTEPQYTPEHQARIAAFKDAMRITKEQNT